MEKPAPEVELKKKDNFMLLLDNKPNNQEYIIEIEIQSSKINIQAVNNCENNFLNYEASYDFDSLVKINDYFKFSQNINNIYDFIIKLKNNNALSLLKESDKIFLCLHLSEPIENIIKIPLNNCEVNNKAIILSLNHENKKLKEKVKILEEKLEKNNDDLKQRLMKKDIKGYSQNLIFIEKEIEKQLKKNVISYDLIYKATRDGDKSENFHSKCDSVENTLVIIKTTLGKIFGGFTTKLWNHKANYTNDPLAFAFSINNQKIYNILDNKKGEFAIYPHNSYGPCFGQGTDFGLYSGCTGRKDNWCSSQKTFNYNGEHLNGTSNFQVLDYEVYHVIFE